MLSVGRHLPILDYKFCGFRLENTEGFLVCQINGSGTAEIFFTNEPCIVPKTLTVGIGDTFCGIASFLGDAGCLRTIKPADGVEGWLKADGNGCFILAPLPTDSGIPDPLQINELIVNETATIKNLVIGETVCFDALETGTVTDSVGLDSNGCLVKGEPPQGISAALYYENASETGTEEPNFNKVDDQSAVIGHEIYDPDGLAHVLTESIIEIDEPGSYEITWLGCFMPSGGAAYNVALDLKINSSIVSNGCGRSQGVSGEPDINRSARVTGMHLVDLEDGDKIELQIGRSSGGGTTARLRDVKLKLVRFKPA